MKVSNYLKRNKLSQRDLCKVLGVSHSAIYNYMNGKRKPKKEILEKVKRIMNTKNVEWK